MTLEGLLPMLAGAGIFDLFLVMIWLVINIVKGFSPTKPVRVWVKDDRGEQPPRQETAKAVSAAPAPPEAVPGPDFAMPEAEADGKVPVTCGKCGTAYRVYPNRLWYTCSKCQEKVWVAKDPNVKVAEKVPAAKTKKDKFKSPANLI